MHRRDVGESMHRRDVGESMHRRDVERRGVSAGPECPGPAFKRGAVPVQKRRNCRKSEDINIDACWVWR
jgi:hypothetical protein